MTIETLKSPNPRNRNSISVIKSNYLSVSSLNTLLAILKVTDARRDVILAGGLCHRFPWRHSSPPPLGRLDIDVLYNRPFPSSKKSHFQSEVKCEAIDMKMIFNCHGNKTHFHNKGFALTLFLKVRFFGTRK